ncbi:MAG: putative ubiquitin, partial [Streblomastix strix]
PGQVMQFEDANERTTFADVAQHVFQSLGDGVKKLSLMAEYGGPFQFEMDQDGQICEIWNNSNTSNKESVELLTGFFSSRISCLVKDCINVDKIRILVNRKDNHFINVHCHVEDTVLDLKKRITAKIHTPVQQQRLSFKWNVLSNDQKITEIDFGQGDEIQLDSDDRILDIKMPNGKQINISVKNEERVKDICKRALQLENINEDGFYLHMNRIKMDKNKFMGEINFPSQCIITIQKKLMIVYSKDLIGKIMALEVESQDTIESVKQQIQKNDGIQSDQYRLIFNGQELEDGKTLNEYNIQDESTMIRVLKLSNLKTTNQSQQNEDVNQLYKMMKKQLIETAHDWCGIWPGLTIEGICENKKCQSYGQIVFY